MLAFFSLIFSFSVNVLASSLFFFLCYRVSFFLASFLKKKKIRKHFWVNFFFFFTLMKCPFIHFFFKYNVFFFVLFNRNMMLNLYKLYFHLNKKNFHPSTFPPPNQTKIRETKNFSILPLFYSLSIFHLLIFSTSQPNRP